MGTELGMDDRRRLEERLKVAQDELAHLDEESEEKGEYGAGRVEPEVVIWEMNMALREQAKARVEQIKKAMRRLEEGTYHTCERCGREIEPERLEAIPETALCTNCAHAVESQP
jgi:RNA polymerase-binding transcription factor DksA